MTTKREAKQAIARLRKGVEPEFLEDVDLIADSLDALVENAAASLGRMGGTARAKKLSKKRRSEIARTAVTAREAKRAKERRELSEKVRRA
jgi:hypothetical protein